MCPSIRKNETSWDISIPPFVAANYPKNSYHSLPLQGLQFPAFKNSSSLPPLSGCVARARRRYAPRICASVAWRLTRSTLYRVRSTDTMAGWSERKQKEIPGVLPPEKWCEIAFILHPPLPPSTTHVGFLPSFSGFTKVSEPSPGSASGWCKHAGDVQTSKVSKQPIPEFILGTCTTTLHPSTPWTPPQLLMVFYFSTLSAGLLKSFFNRTGCRVALMSSSSL